MEIGASTRTASQSPWIRVHEIGEKALLSLILVRAIGRREETQTARSIDAIWISLIAGNWLEGMIPPVDQGGIWREWIDKDAAVPYGQYLKGDDVDDSNLKL